MNDWPSIVVVVVVVVVVSGVSGSGTSHRNGRLGASDKV